ncbi:MAG: atoB [Holophagaceae bacterium]|nr:atoB [Holophagaceae bacterium]
MNREIVVLSAVRSAIGSFGGALKDMDPCALGGLVIKEAIQRAGVDGNQVTYATVGNTIPADGRFPYVARVSSVAGGMPMDSVAFGVNRLCASGLQAIVSTSQAILLGEADFGIGGGVEVMSRGGYLMPNARWGARMGDTPLVDMMVGTLTDPFGAGHMGVTAENVAAKWGITRQEQDELALESQLRAARAIKAGHFTPQIVPVILRSKKGDITFDTDEHPRPTSPEALAAMKPAFKKDGTVTAGNASGLNDGAAFFLLAEASAAQKGGHKPIARLVSWAVAGVPNELMGEGPIPASRLALSRAGLRIDQMDVVESNEAFAAQAIAVSRALGLDPAKTNPNGGAIALGHPIGASGAFIATKALHELERIQGRHALVTMCIGGGQGIAVVFERI